MIVEKLREAGFYEAMLGLSLNKNQPIGNMPAVAERLALVTALDDLDYPLFVTG